MIQINIYSCAKFIGSFLAGIDDEVYLGLDLLVGVGTNLTGKRNGIGDDVGGSATFDPSDV